MSTPQEKRSAIPLSTHRDCDEFYAALPDEIAAQLDEMLADESNSVSGPVILYHQLTRHDPSALGAILLCLHCWKADPEVMRTCIRHFWKTDAHAILRSPGFSLERAREMFRRALFRLPDGLPPVVRVWRGAAGRSFDEVCKGLCWTADPDAACWFATLYEHRAAGEPIVVMAEISRDQILFIDDDDGLLESELVIDQVRGATVIPGTQAEWRERGRRFIERRRRTGF